METEKKIRIKKFFYGIVAFIILLNLVLTEKNRVGRDVNNYLASFNKIDGVSVGTDVVISGIKVGEVKQIFIKDNYPQISMNVNKNIKISDDSSVSIQTDGLFGKKFLLIEIGGNDVYLKNGEKFSFSEDSIVIEDLLGKIILIGEKNNQTLGGALEGLILFKHLNFTNRLFPLIISAIHSPSQLLKIRIWLPTVCRITANK